MAVGILFGLFFSLLITVDAIHLRRRLAQNTVAWSASNKAPKGNWIAVASDSNTGKIIYGIVQGSPAVLYKSDNFGYNFTQLSGGLPSNLGVVTCDSTGQYVAVATSTGGGIYISKNYGQSFANSNATTSSGWISITSTSDVSSSGSNWQIIASNKNGKLYMTTNSGSSWTAQTAQCGGIWQSVTMNSDGESLAAVCLTSANVSSISYSKNYGSQWVASTTVFPVQLSPYLAASQGTGEFLVIGAYSQNTIYTSSNYGKSFVSAPGPVNITGPVNWGEVVMDQSGQYASMAADLTEDGQEYAALFFSQNYGKNWARTGGTSKFINGISVDYNASRWVAGGYRVLLGKLINPV